MSLEIRYLSETREAAESMASSTVSSVYGVNTDVSDVSEFRGSGSPDIPYATLERNIWKLDGSRKLMKGTGEYWLWGKYVHGFLQVTIKMPRKISAQGITIRFSPSTNQWPESVRIMWKNDGSTLKDQTFYPDAPILRIQENVSEFDELYIDAGAKSGEFVKIQKITFGNEYTFGKESLLDVRMVTESDPSLCSLPADTISFTVKDKEGNLFEPAEGARVELYKNGTMENTQFVKDFERIAKDRYKIVCQSLIGMLDRKYYGKILTPGGPVNSEERAGNTWGTAKREIWRISGEGKRFAVKYNTQNSQEDIILAGYLPVCTEKEALQQVLFASGLVASTRDGTLTLSTLSSEVTSEFTKKDILSWSKVKKLKPIGSVEVYSVDERYKNMEVTASGEKDVVQEIPQIAHFLPRPIWSTTEEILDDATYGAGWIALGYTGELSTDSYIEYTKNKHVQTVPGAGASGETITVDNCTLIVEENLYESEWKGYPGVTELLASTALQETLDRMSNCAQLRVLVEEDVIVTNQRAGDYVRTLTPWGTMVEGYIISMDASLTQNAHRAKIKILGKEVT